ncbi:cbb3-type cytochrome c oxidase subunit 3 [Alcaligenaceae bacterium 429]|jgi:cytochrome c oxidase cbb3-type subunit 4|uniref:cbb3-type cytochrome oxidase subunit 3 n=1 Tax=Paenalcaligenes sp. Me52 TaxID=3392038 RepID=UPI001092E183|nr:cbb3-type cytochrome c oxidase subunit 3 [Alcaligenaceae bacterium 429]
MVAFLNGLMTILGIVTFIGIVIWAWSDGRKKANHDGSMLPFALPDEADEKGGSNE